MTIDFEQLARSARCDGGHLRSAVALLRQGYRPSFLARYRRDELGGISESALWAADLAVRAEERLAKRKAELLRRSAQANPPRPVVEAALAEACSDHELDLAARLLKAQALDATDAHRLAQRLLRPLAGDSSDPKAIVRAALNSDDPIRTEASLAGWVDSLPDMLVHDLRILRAASQWLDKNARVQIGDITDPQHDDAEPESEGDDEHADNDAHHFEAQEELAATLLTDEAPAAGETESVATDTSAAEASAASVPVETPAENVVTEETVAETTTEDASATEDAAPAETVASKPNEPKKKKGGKEPNKQRETKRMSPRQRRRRWLVGVLKPLAAKTLPPHRLTGFQKLMLLRGERSSVAHPRLVYDRQALVRHLQKVGANFNPSLAKTIRDKIEEVADPLLSIAEQFFWEEQLQRVRSRLVLVAADRFRRDNLRPSLPAKRVLAIDAVGPRSVAVAIVRRSGRIEHTEDIPCQLAGPFRQQMVMRLGELIHKHRVDLLVVSNGPARRAALAALRDLFAQSQPGSLHWTIVDRSGADLFASGPSGDRHMRNLPRRFRAAAWLALHLVKPIDAVAELDPTRLRLCSYQRELPKAELRDALVDLLGGALAGRGADVNADSVGLISQMPGVTSEMASKVDSQRRQQLIGSRAEVGGIEGWTDTDRRQALPFLRVYGGEKSLDATAIHPDDYRLAERLIAALQIPEPPTAPPGYQTPDYSRKQKPAGGKQAAESSNPEAAEGTPSDDAAAPDNAAVLDNAAPESTDSAIDNVSPTNAETAALVAAETQSSPVEAASDTEASVVETSSEAPIAELAPAIEGFGGSIKPETILPASETVAIDDEPEFEPIKHPVPAEEKIRKVIKEWQVGQYRVRQIIHWLCEPFGVDRVDGSPATMMDTVPTLADLKVGQPVAGVVVGVTPFGAFVELAPDCNGLVHVSRLTEGYLEDPHEAVQVGDVVNAFVVEIDAKRRRVALSCIAPERQAALDEQRRQQQNPRDQERGGGRFQQREGGGQQRGGRGGRGDGPGAAQGGQGNQRGGHANQRGGQGSQGGGFGGQGGGNRGGGARDGGQRGGQRGFGGQKQEGGFRGGRPGGRNQRRDRQDDAGDQNTPRVQTRVERPQPSKPITDSMKTGEEPLRSFGDLLQFYQMKEAPTPVVETPKPAAETPADEPAPATEPTASNE